MQFQTALTTTAPVVQTVTVVSAENDEVTIDGNHPLAGLTLHFAVDIVERSRGYRRRARARARPLGFHQAFTRLFQAFIRLLSGFYLAFTQNG